MYFENPAKKKIKRYEEILQDKKEEKIEEISDENIILLDSILNTDTTSIDNNVSNSIEVEYIQKPNFVNIKSVPSSIDLDIGQIGKLIMKYENYIENQKGL